MGHRDALGYGKVHRTKGSTHVVAYELTVGPIPAGKVLDHFRCSNRSCCNPTHLRPVTRRENVLRGDGPAALNLGKTHCKRGHPFDEANTYYLSDGARRCRTCRKSTARSNSR